MLEIEEINSLLGVDESWKAPERLMKVLFSDEKDKIFRDFLAKEPNLSYDWFTDYYQEEHSDRKNNKQDFTPNKVTELMSKLLGSTTYNADICAGTGGLTIKRWLDNKQAHFYCEEFSDRALPFLLFNLAIRNVNAEVFHGDSLTEEPKALYQLTANEKFSTITTVEDFGTKLADTVIMNPPYSFKWNQVDEPRFTNYGPLAPKSKADYAFLLAGLNNLSNDGTMAIILPHGVLFRGAAEGKIRQKMIELNLLDAVIGLPGKLFLNTDIPTVILVLKKNRTGKDIYFIDASKEFTKGKNHNYLEDKHVTKILKAYQSRKNIEKFASVVGLDELKENDFNLNIPRYVDTFEPEKVPELREIQADMQKIDKQIDETVSDLVQMMSELTTPDQAELDEFVGYLTQRYNVGGQSMIDLNTYEVVKLEDIADFGRAKQGHVYPAGTSWIQISATRGQLGYLIHPDTIHTKNVAIIPQGGVEPFYFHISMQAGIDEFMAKYATGLNIKEQEVGKFKIRLHNVETQKAMIKVYKLWEQERKTTMAEIEKLNDLKNYLLNNMFV